YPASACRRHAGKTRPDLMPGDGVGPPVGCERMVAVSPTRDFRGNAAKLVSVEWTKPGKPASAIVIMTCLLLVACSGTSSPAMHTTATASATNDSADSSGTADPLQQQIDTALGGMEKVRLAGGKLNLWVKVSPIVQEDKTGPGLRAICDEVPD